MWVVSERTTFRIRSRYVESVRNVTEQCMQGLDDADAFEWTLCLLHTCKKTRVCNVEKHLSPHQRVHGLAAKQPISHHLTHHSTATNTSRSTASSPSDIDSTAATTGGDVHCLRHVELAESIRHQTRLRLVFRRRDSGICERQRNRDGRARFVCWRRMHWT